MKIKDTEILLKTKFIYLKATEYEDNEGNDKFWVWAQRPNDTKAVVIVPLIDDGDSKKLVVIKEFRVPLNDYEWGFPAGLVNKGEDPVEAAKRELTEETSLIVKEVIRSSPYIYNTAGMTDESISMVYVKCEGKVSKEFLESSEDIETHIMNQEQVKELLEDKNKKFGAKAWMVLDFFARNNDI